MSTRVNYSATTTPYAASPLVTWIKGHALVAFFMMAYGFAWLLWIPGLVLSQDGLGWLPFRMPVLPLVILGGFAPAAAGFIATVVIEGRAGVKALLRRCVQWRVGVRWYTLLFLIPIMFLLISAVLGAIDPGIVLQNSFLLVTLYPLVLVIQTLVAGGLGEEPGWRGFALPALQSRFGPLAGSLLLGFLHVCWHIPLFFVPSLSQAHFNFLLYLLTGLAISVFLTWVYNNTSGSLFIIMLLHEAQDTTSALSLRMAPAYLDRTPAYALTFGLLAIIVLLITRGTLSFVPHASIPEEG